jgi:hypothetical protein
MCFVTIVVLVQTVTRRITPAILTFLKKVRRFLYPGGKLSLHELQHAALDDGRYALLLNSRLGLGLGFELGLRLGLGFRLRDCG